MKKVSKRSALLFGTALAVCAFAGPMASAASFFPVGVTAQLTSNDFGLSQAIGGGFSLGWSCATTQFDSDITSAAVETITGGRFDNCRGTGIAAGCTVTATGTHFPWSVIAPTTTSIQMRGLHVDVRYETAPGGGACIALVHNQDITYTGTLANGVVDPATVPANRRMTFVNASGVVSHGAFGVGLPTTGGGTFRDPAGNWGLFD
ncbi:MAG TPA: hypothetical protein VFY45_07475 [Baekduia sp.]|nr:hypothetical protein [Baekduia sp.]